MKAFTALVPQIESNVQTMLGDVFALPKVAESIDMLSETIAAEHPADLPVKFADVTMDENDAALCFNTLKCQYTRHALTQAVLRIKPEGTSGVAGYLAACPPDLRAINYNFWHQNFYGPEVSDPPKNDVMLRTRFNGVGSVVRAVVSQSYSPIDDLPLVREFQSIAPAGAHMRSVRGDLKSRFDVIWPTMKRLLIPGEPLMVAVRLANSETGVSSIRLDPIVYFARYSSSIIIPTRSPEVVIRHIGEAANRLTKGLIAVMSTIDPFVDMLHKSYTDMIIGQFESIDQMFECLRRAFKLNATTVLRLQNTLVGISRADVITAMAQAANDMPIEDGEELQRAAGVLASKGWKFIKKFAEED